MVLTRLCTQNTWPSRSSSRRIASTATRSSYSPTKVRIGWRSAGGVCSNDRSRMPTRLISSVRGMGVADSVSTSTLVFSFFIASLACTPKRCSSSTISRPRSLNVDRVLQQAVRADDAVDLAALQPVEHLLGLLVGEEAD